MYVTDYLLRKFLTFLQFKPFKGIEISQTVFKYLILFYAVPAIKDNNDTSSDPDARQQQTLKTRHKDTKNIKTQTTRNMIIEMTTEKMYFRQF